MYKDAPEEKNHETYHKIYESHHNITHIIGKVLTFKKKKKQVWHLATIRQNWEVQNSEKI